MAVPTSTTCADKFDWKRRLCFTNYLIWHEISHCATWLFMFFLSIGTFARSRVRVEGAAETPRGT